MGRLSMYLIERIETKAEWHAVLFGLRSFFAFADSERIKKYRHILLNSFCYP